MLRFNWSKIDPKDQVKVKSKNLANLIKLI